MEFNTSNISSWSNELSSSKQQISNSLNSDWNDDVGESFHDFIDVYETEINAISDLMESLPELLQTLEEVNSEKLNAECDKLLSEIED